MRAEADGGDAAWAAVRAAEPHRLDRDGVVALVGEVRRVRSMLDAVERRAVRRPRELEAAGASERAESVLVNHGGQSGRDARAAGERDELCNDVPEVEDALDDGSVGGEYVDAIAAAAKGLPDEVRTEFLSHHGELLARAARLGLDAFRRECRELAKHVLARSRCGATDELGEQVPASSLRRWVDKTTGMHHTRLELDPVRDAKLQATWRANIAALRRAPAGAAREWEQLQIDAFLHAVGGTGPGRADRLPEITVVVDYRYLAGIAASGVCETEGGVPLPVTAVRRLCGDAEVIPTVLGGHGEVLDQGRSRRTASRAQRRALRALHRTCAHPDCSVGYDWCRLHHIRWWLRDRGPTDIDNLLPLCGQHHHLVHEGGWGPTLDAGRVAT